MAATHAASIAAYLITWIPDWNSLDSVRRAHSRLELASIVFFGLLAFAEAIAHKCKDEYAKDRWDTAGIVFFIIAVVCEGIAYPYGQRNDTLSEQIIGSLSNKVTEAKDSADIAAKDATVAKEGAASAGSVADRASKGEAALERENAVLRAKMAPRRVSGDRAKKLCTFLHRVDHPYEMDIGSSAGSPEADDFAADIGKAIVNCQVGISVMLHPNALISPLPRPLRIAYAPAREGDAEMLSEAMVRAQIITKTIQIIPAPDAAQYPDALRLFVGPKLPER